MRRFSLISGWFASLCFVVPSLGTTITFSDLRRDAALGVHIQPAGPDNLPMALGGSEVYGATAAFLNNSVTSRYYTGNAKFDQPASEISFDVERLNDSGWNIPFTLAGFSNRKRVAIMTVDVKPLGDVTRVTLSAPSIDRIGWAGSGWVFHPYKIDDFQVTFLASAPSVSNGNTFPPNVGTGTLVPEPTAAAMCGIFSAATLLQRRRRRDSRITD